MSEKKKFRCDECKRDFKKKEALDMHNAAKHSVEVEEKPEKASPKINYKKMRNWGIFLVVLLGVLYLVFSGSSGGGLTLPPTDMQGHVEASPASHVIREPMPLAIQKHMLEHADGTGPPGVILNYNCDDYTCERGLIENLEAFATKYPENVYVASFSNMDAKIVLTKLNRIEILEEYDEGRINSFIIGF